VLLARVGLIGAFDIFSVCSHADEITIGKYFCYVSHMAGIQQRDDGQVSAGNFKPQDENFFIDIHAALHPKDLCDTQFGATSHDQGNWFLCHATYEVQINNGPRLRGDLIFSFIGVPPFTEEFDMYSDGTFHRYQTLLTSGGLFVSDGKCTKI
jgi:hypothetical protein